MKNLVKVKSVSFMVSFNLDLEVGQVKATAVTQAFIYINNEGKLDGDFDLADYENITYMDMPIEGYAGFKKLKEFHTNLGIDIDKLLEEKYNLVINEEFKLEFMKSYNAPQLKI